MITKLLKFICEKLEEKEIEYMISGSLAMITYTIPRMTRDIDIVINLNQENLDKFKDIFKFHFYFNEDTINKELKCKGMFNVIDQNTGYKIDFIIRKDNEFRINEFKRKVQIDDFGFPCWIVTKEDLIISKLTWIQQLQSNVQIEDIKNLLDEDVDIEYLKNWIKKLNLQTFDLI